MVILGRVVRPHGLKGEVRVSSFARSLVSFIGQGEVWLKPIQGRERFLSLEWAREHPKGVLLKLKGIDDPEEARVLVGAEVGVSRSALPATEEGEYYWVDLIGLEVRDEQGCKVGRIKTLFETKAHEVLVVQSGGREVLIPVTEASVAEVDLAGGVVKVRAWEHY